MQGVLFMGAAGQRAQPTHLVMSVVRWLVSVPATCLQQLGVATVGLAQSDVPCGRSACDKPGAAMRD